jgi:hypothetical protein
MLRYLLHLHNRMAIHPYTQRQSVHGVRCHAEHVTILLFQQSECTPDVDAEAVPIVGTWLDAS